MSTIPAPPPMPPAPSPIAEHKITGQVSNISFRHSRIPHNIWHFDGKEVPKLPPPIWLEEIQSNAIFNKQRHKLLLEKQSHVEKEVDLKKPENHPIRRGLKLYGHHILFNIYALNIFCEGGKRWLGGQQPEREQQDRVRSRSRGGRRPLLK